MKLFLIMLAGALGTGARYGINLAVTNWLHGRGSQTSPGHVLHSSFPLGILVINVAGALLLALLTFGLAARGKADWLPILGTGFCGGFTTFSTFELDAERLLRDGAWLSAALYIGGNLVLGFLAILLGRALAVKCFGAPGHLP